LVSDMFSRQQQRNGLFEMHLLGSAGQV